MTSYSSGPDLDIESIGLHCRTDLLPDLARSRFLTPATRTLLISNALNKGIHTLAVQDFILEVLKYGMLSSTRLMTPLSKHPIYEPMVRRLESWMLYNHLPIILICGYVRMGKDGVLSTLQGSGLYRYDVYTTRVEYKSALLLPGSWYHRVALADELKKRVGLRLKLSVPELDALKDKPLCHPYTFKATEPYFPMYRSVLIDYATNVRATDPDYWSRTAFNLSFRPDSANVVTDFRFPNELAFFQREAQGRKVITLRIHRPSVTIPDGDIESEHALDDLEPDLFLVPRGTHIEKLHAVYPYLIKYKLTHTL